MRDVCVARAEFKAAVSQYGFYSSVALLFKYLHLVNSLKDHDPQSDVRESVPVMENYAVLKDHFTQNASPLQPSGHAAHLVQEEIGDRALIRYDPAAFRANHPDAPTLPADSWGPIESTPFVDCAFHIYAVDARGSLVIEAKPISPIDLFTRGQGKKVTHAHLVSDRGLAVTCAGEAVFVRGAAQRCYAIINNRSGHFLPRRRNLTAAVDDISSALRVRPENIFTLCVARD